MGPCYTLMQNNMAHLSLALPKQEPGYRELWPGEIIPEDAQEWSDLIHRWIAPARTGVPYAPNLQMGMICRIMRVSCSK